jgi:hypothetical protein
MQQNVSIPGAVGGVERRLTYSTTGLLTVDALYLNEPTCEKP